MLAVCVFVCVCNKVSCALSIIQVKRHADGSWWLWLNLIELHSLTKAIPGLICMQLTESISRHIINSYEWLINIHQCLISNQVQSPAVVRVKSGASCGQSTNSTWCLLTFFFFFCLLLCQLVSEVRSSQRSGTMWLLFSSLTLLAIGFGTCDEAVPEPGEFRIRRMWLSAAAVRLFCLK